MNITAVHPLAAAARARGLRGWTARRPLAAFLVLAFAGIYPIVSPPILASHGLIPGGGLLDRLPISPDELAGLLITMFGLPATLYVTWAADGRDGLRRLWSRMLRWRVGPAWLLVRLAMPIAAIVLTAVTAVVIRRRLTRAYRAQLDALPGSINPTLLSGRTPR